MTRQIYSNPDPSATGFWHPSVWYLAQTVHTLAGAAVILAAHVHGWDVATVAAVFVLLTAAKEFFLDTSPFEGDSLWGSLQDWLAYLAGLIGAWVALSHFWPGVGIVAGAVLVVFGVDVWRTARWPGPRSPYD